MTEPEIDPNTRCPHIEEWRPVTGESDLPEGALHLWKWETGHAAEAPQADRRLLSPSELHRAEAMGNPALRNSFIMNRSAKRRILGAYLNLSPERIRFGYGPRGKPHIEHPTTDLQFNLSHSGTVSLLAVTRACEIGIDLEQVRQRSHMPAIARRMFGPERAQQLEALPEEERLRMFYVYWTWLEARVKTRGGGLFHAGSRASEDLEHRCFVPHPGFQACITTAGEYPALEGWGAFLYSG